MPGTEYERELKGILEADRKTLARVTKSCSAEESMNYYLIEKVPFFVVRAAGSLGIDLIAMRGELSFPIEVKSSKNTVLRLNTKYLGEQAKGYLDIAEKTGVVPIYAYRIKGVRGDSWRVFSLPFQPKGLMVMLRDVPRARVTDSGNYVLEWDKGMPMNRFIKYLHTLLTDIPAY